MDNFDSFLELIEKGDAAVILAEKNLSKTFDDLLKHGMIDYRDGKIYLTEKGLEAKKAGFAVVMQQLQNQKPVQKQVLPVTKRFPFRMVLAILLTFLLMVIYLLLLTLEII